MEDNCGAGICITSDIDFAVRLLALTGTRSASIRSTTAVTELDLSMLRVHLEGDYERAIFLARQLHERMYPGAVGEPFGSGMTKQRSAYSSLLVRANNSPRNSQ